MTYLYPSLEAIDFQRSSSLAKGLVELCQDVINYRDSIQTTIPERVKLTVEYVQKHFYKRFSTIVKSTTGLNCSKIVFSKSLDCGFSTVMDIGDKYGLNAAAFIDTYSGTGMQTMYKWILEEYEMRQTKVDDLVKLVNSLRKDTGIYKVDQLYDGRKVSFVLYFDPYSAFLVQEVGHNKCLPMNAEEITAIILHEIGHLHSLLEHALDGCMKTSVALTAFDYFNQHASLEEKSKLVSLLAETNSNNGYDSSVPRKLDELLKNREDTVGAKIGDGANALITLLLTTGRIALTPLAVVGWLFAYSADNSNLIALNMNPTKLSDPAVSAHNFKLSERLADQFVVRHGMAHALVSALSKLDHNSTSKFGMNSFCKNSSLMWYTTKVQFFVRYLLLGDVYHLEEHDDMPVRGELMMQETIQVFKQQLPPDMLALYLNDYEATLKALKDRTWSERITAGILYFNQMLRYLIETPCAMILSGRFPKEYEQLIYKIKQLTDNKLYYRAAKLQQLLNLK